MLRILLSKQFFLPGEGSVQLKDDKFPEVFLNGTWSPICGHHFWDTDFGAQLFCQKLTSNSFSNGSVIKRTDKPLEKDAIRIGKCLSNDTWLSCSGGCEGCDKLCDANSPASIEIKCFSQGKKYYKCMYKPKICIQKIFTHKLCIQKATFFRSHFCVYSHHSIIRYIVKMFKP